MMLNLEITIDPKSGFCHGVVNAIKIAEDYLKQHQSLYCLGDIVHNDLEIKRLEMSGLVTISYEEFKNLRNTTVLIRAHGEPPETYRIAAENQIELIDASCSVVKKLQKKVKLHFDKQEAPIYIFGKHGHAEVRGLTGQINGEATVFQSQEELKKLSLPEKIVLICQTTMNTEDLKEIKSYLDDRNIEVDYNDSICRQVSNRNIQLRDFVRKYDKVIFVAGRKSSNGKALFESCKKYNPGSWFISDKKEIQSDWFVKNDKVGICGATSTPMWLMQEVKSALESL
jgi:4-hydroxy-3-methylbut-2-enyl diphosphate reductase